MEILFLLPLLIFSVIFHEVSHGIVAHHYGDDTAYLSGRITLNPLPHLDPIGSIIFPAFCFFLHVPVFGWAKPVPVNPSLFTKYRSGVIWVSLAGPLTNFLIAMVSVVLLYFSVTQSYLINNFPILPKFLTQAILLNLVLSVFNLFPIPPLDGSKVLSVLLPRSLARVYDLLEPYGFFIMMILIVLGVLNQVLYPVVGWIYQRMLGVFGL